MVESIVRESEGNVLRSAAWCAWFVGLVGLSAAACGTVAGGVKSIDWRTAVVRGATTIGTQVASTSSGSQVSVLFDDVVARLDAPDGVRDRTAIASFVVPFQAHPPGAGCTPIRHRVRGFIGKTSGARARVWLVAGSAARTLSFEYGTDLDRDWFEELLSLEPEGVAAEPLVVVIQLERRSDADRVSVAVDSVDSSHEAQ